MLGQRAVCQRHLLPVGVVCCQVLRLVLLSGAAPRCVRRAICFWLVTWMPEIGPLTNTVLYLWPVRSCEPAITHDHFTAERLACPSDLLLTRYAEQLLRLRLRLLSLLQLPHSAAAVSNTYS
jgi:hypothetical protein